MANEIHPTALIHDGAEIAEGVEIGPFTVIGPEVKIGQGTKIRSHVIIEADTTIGERCEIFPFVTIGLPPQDMKYKGEKSGVRIGSGNVIREGVIIHRASTGGDGFTTIGNDNFIMTYVHIAHDCKLGDNIIIASNVGLSGHVTVGDHAVIGGMTGIHQYVRIGAYAMIGGMSSISNEIPPYVLVSGKEKAKLYGLNKIGLKRKGFAEGTVNELKTAYDILFNQKLSLTDALKKVQEELPYTDEIKYLVEFIRDNKRGITR